MLYSRISALLWSNHRSLNFMSLYRRTLFAIKTSFNPTFPLILVLIHLLWSSTKKKKYSLLQCNILLRLSSISATSDTSFWLPVDIWKCWSSSNTATVAHYTNIRNRFRSLLLILLLVHYVLFIGSSNVTLGLNKQLTCKCSKVFVLFLFFLSWQRKM